MLDGNEETKKPRDAIPLKIAIGLVDKDLIDAWKDASAELKESGRWFIDPADHMNPFLDPKDPTNRVLFRARGEATLAVFNDLAKKMHAGSRLAYGRSRSPVGKWRRIEPSAWSVLRIEDLAKGIVAGGDITLYDVHIAPEGAGEAASLKADSDSPAGPTSGPMKPRRKPGRPPGPKELVLDKFARCCAEGTVESGSLDLQGEVLAIWLHKHLGRKALSGKTIATYITEPYWSYWSTRKGGPPRTPTHGKRNPKTNPETSPKK